MLDGGPLVAWLVALCHSKCGVCLTVESHLGKQSLDMLAITENTRFGIIGLGNEAKNTYIPAFQRAGMRFSAGADVDPQDRWDFPVYPSLSQMFEHENLDFVIICTDPVHHYQLVASALDLSVSVICEKPLIATPRQVRELFQEFSNSDLFLCVIDNWCHSQQFQSFLSSCRTIYTDYNAPAMIEFHFCRPLTLKSKWRSQRQAGGLVWEYGWHAICMALAVASSLDLSVPPFPRQWSISNSTISHDAVHFIITMGSLVVSTFIQRKSQDRSTTIIFDQPPRRIVLDDSSLSFQMDGTPMNQITFSSPALSQPQARVDWFIHMLSSIILDPICAAYKSCVTAEACVTILNAVFPLDLSGMKDGILNTQLR